MDIAAIITVAGDQQGQESWRSHETYGMGPSQDLFGSPVAFCSVLGRQILDHSLERLRRFGIEEISVISENSPVPSRETRGHLHSTFWSAWDNIVSRYLSQGFGHLLLLRLGCYAEVDLGDLLRFHHQSSSSLTQVCCGRDALDMVLVNAAGLRIGAQSYRSKLSGMIARRRRYAFGGYFNSLATPREFRTFVRDTLLGRTEIRPHGQEIRPGVWFGDGVQVDMTARIEAPAYIGANTRVGPSCLISGATAIEHNSEVDCGTTVDQCCVLPGTYVGMGLQLTNAVVAASRIFHLQRNLELSVIDPRIIGSARLPHPRLKNELVRRASFLLRNSRRTASALSTRSLQAASFMSSRWLGRYG